MYADSYGSGLYIGAVTKFLMENGINPYDYFKDEIPSCCFCATKAIDHGGELYLPKNIKRISDNAFNDSPGFHCADLRHIEYIGEGAFCYSDLTEVKFLFQDNTWMI